MRSQGFPSAMPGLSGICRKQMRENNGKQWFFYLSGHFWWWRKWLGLIVRGTETVFSTHHQLKWKKCYWCYVALSISLGQMTAQIPTYLIKNQNKSSDKSVHKRVTLSHARVEYVWMARWCINIERRYNVRWTKIVIRHWYLMCKRVLNNQSAS